METGSSTTRENCGALAIKLGFELQVLVREPLEPTLNAVSRCTGSHVAIHTSDQLA